MRVFSSIILLSLLSLASFSQATKPKPKPTPAKQTAKKTVTPAKKTTSAAKTDTAKKTATARTPATTAKKPAAQKPKQPVVKKPDEKAEWEKAIAVEAPVEKIASLRKFLEVFPESTRRIEALTLLAGIGTDLGHERLTAGDIPGAAEFYRNAAKDAPTPIPEPLFTDSLSKISTNLFFRGGGEAAFEVAKVLESKAFENAAQLLNLATFYMSVESGTDARRVAEMAIKLDPESAAAYQTLGLANRMDFQLDLSASAYAKALELDPESVTARRGLAEMKRALGLADEAAALYREILEKEPDNLPARSGLILSMFEGGNRTEAEAELSRSLEVNPGNVILLAGVAYWHVSHNEGEKAVDYAQRAIAVDPRFIWSHIALGRGFMLQNRPLDAERTLLAARRYGNFPTLEYEIAAARAAAGFYRDAGEELLKSFSVKNGKIQTRLGGRVMREFQDISELVSYERRASIFAPTAADNPESSAQLAALLAFTQELRSDPPHIEAITKAADDLARGSDKMRVHRQIFAASQLLDRRLALPKAVELTKAAVAGVDDGLEPPHAAAAVLASELYERRNIAVSRGEYLNMPEVPKSTLSAILRGRLEEINGWAQFHLNNADEAVLRLRRAVTVLPVDSVWWRATTWRLGSALALAEKHEEALEWYIKSYKGTAPDAFRFAVIEETYRKVNGNTDGLEANVGPRPELPVSSTTVAAVTPAPTPEASPQKSPEPDPTPAPSPEESPTPTPDPTPEPSPEESPTPEPDPTPEPSPEESPIPTPTPEPTPEESSTPSPTPTPETVGQKVARTGTEIFPPVVITIPKPEPRDTTVSRSDPSPKPTPEVVEEANDPKADEEKTDEAKPREGRPRVVRNDDESVDPCVLTTSESVVTLKVGGGDLAVIVGREDDGDLDDLSALSSSLSDVNVRREIIVGVKSRAIFVVRSVSAKAGLYQVTFELPCGKKTISVNVR